MVALMASGMYIMGKASISLFFLGCMENLHSIIGGATTGRRLIADQSGIPQTPNIHTISLVVIIAPEFTGIFADAIDRNRFDDGMLGTIDFG
jgi:hypothetical protein